ncbi:unnamed protein product, partial [Discosporangium mesarthrocarpum]
MEASKAKRRRDDEDNRVSVQSVPASASSDGIPQCSSLGNQLARSGPTAPRPRGRAAYSVFRSAPLTNTESRRQNLVHKVQPSEREAGYQSNRRVYRRQEVSPAQQSRQADTTRRENGTGERRDRRSDASMGMAQPGGGPGGVPNPSTLASPSKIYSGGAWTQEWDGPSPQPTTSGAGKPPPMIRAQKRRGFVVSSSGAAAAPSPSLKPRNVPTSRNATMRWQPSLTSQQPPRTPVVSSLQGWPDVGTGSGLRQEPSIAPKGNKNNASLPQERRQRV